MALLNAGYCAFHLRVNNRCQDELDDIKLVAYALAYMHAKHKSPSIPRAPCGDGGSQGANWAKRRRGMEAGGLNLQHLISAK